MADDGGWAALEEVPHPRLRWRGEGLLWAICVALLAALLSYPIFSAIIASGAGDYVAHEAFAERLEAGERLELPHLLYQQLLLGIRAVTGATLQDAAIGLMLTSQAAAGVTVFLLISSLLPCGRRWRALATAAAVAILFAGPVLLDPASELSIYLLGYFVLDAFHNPTYVLSKPLSLALLLGLSSLLASSAPRWLHVLLVTVLVMLSALAKPAFLIALLPGAVALTGIRPDLRRRLFSRATLGAFFIPAVGLLGWQYLLTYGESGAGVVWAPFAVVRHWIPDLAELPPKLLASIVFPVVTAILYRGRCLRDVRLLLAWLTFAFGAAYSYLLAEEGGRFDHGNFVWSGYLGLFVLFCASAAFVAEQAAGRQAGRRDAWRPAAAALALALHVVGGIRHMSVHVPDLF